MACIKNITGNRTVPCGVTAGFFVPKPLSAKFINAGWINSYTLDGNLAVLTRAPGSPACTSLETANNSLVVNLALKGGESYPQAWDVSVEFSFFQGGISSDALGAADGAGVNARGYIAVSLPGGEYYIYGLGNPLECLSVEGSSTGNGYLRTTFGVEDWQAGTTIYRLSKATYDALSTVAPTEGGVTPDKPTETDTPSNQKECDGSGILSDGTKCPGCIMCDPLG